MQNVVIYGNLVIGHWVSPGKCLLRNKSFTRDQWPFQILAGWAARLRARRQQFTALYGLDQPKISDVEIISCFADLRGFSAYCQSLQREHQDRKIQNFLKVYPRIYLEGLSVFLSRFAEKNSPIFAQSVANIAKYLVPTTYKNLGDGMLLVWEMPPELTLIEQSDIPDAVLSVIETIYERFIVRFRDLDPVEQDCFGDGVLSLNLGFGVAKGHAWKLDFGDHVDYAGTIMNMASRLQNLARPGGIVALRDTAPWLVDHSSTHNDGHLAVVEGLKGIEGKVTVWLSEIVDHSNADFQPIEKAPAKIP